MESKTDAVLRAKSRVEAFVLRARRVAAHSLSQDAELLRIYSDQGFPMKFYDDGTVLVEWPREEDVESAAARVRPILLSDEPCYYASVIKDLGLLLDENHPERAKLTDRRKLWVARLEPVHRDSDSGAITLMPTALVDGKVKTVNGAVLAFDWLYGDTIHHDPERRSEAQGFSIRIRFMYAVSLVAFVIVQSISLLDLITALSEEGAIAIDKSVFSEDVVVPTGRVQFGVSGLTQIPEGSEVATAAGRVDTGIGRYAVDKSAVTAIGWMIDSEPSVAGR